jgi:trehalose 6-phosphate phosphatase
MDALDALRRDPAAAGVFVDFDGTLSPIVTVASDARPLPGVCDVLVRLTHALGRVAVVSGRPLSYLSEHLPAEVELHGLYGLESRVDAEDRIHADAARWRPVIAGIAAEAAHALATAGVDVEDKGLSLTLHFRRVPDAEDQALDWARTVAARTELHLRAAKKSLELHPPVSVDKGTIVEERSEGLGAVTYIGDDVGDLPAFEALDRLAERGLAAVKVAVRTPDVSAALTQQAHVLVDGPQGALELLRSLEPDG